MALERGSRLGPYEIVAALGAGGMGEVYRARDTRLERSVAIKILPPHLTTSAAARERFQREARAVAGLQHPNICTIFDIGETEDHQHFIVMELLDGETLHYRLGRGPFDLEQIVDLGAAMADALDVAHSHGLIHRDIKPANIFLTGRGPKILDFGLAKTVATAAAASLQPTLSSPMLTDPGSTVGTIAYMSPEQLRGQDLDLRTDLFSLGLVFYEMATGRAAFSGPTSAVISANILHQSPVAPRQLRPDLPASLEQAILKTLEKDRDTRCQTASELRADLKRVKREIGSGVPTAAALSTTGATAIPTPPPPSASSDAQVAVALVSRHSVLATIVALAVVVALGGAIYTLRQRPVAETPGTPATSPDTFEVVQLTTSGNAERPAISPDGRYVAYIQRDGNAASLWIRQTGTTSNVQIVPAEAGVDLLGATVTPDGSFVDFLRLQTSRLGLWRVPFLGGAPRLLIDDVATPIGWSPQGDRLAFVRANGRTGTDTLIVANPDGTGEHVLATRQRPAWFTSLNRGGNPRPTIRPSWSPDGRLIAVWAGDQSSDGILHRQIVVVDVSSGTERVLELAAGSINEQGVAWLDDRSLVVNHAAESGAPTQVWRLTYPDGRLSRLSNDANAYAGVNVSADATILATMRSEGRVAIWSGDGSGLNGNDVAGPRPLSGGGGQTVAWARDRLLYMTSAPGRPTIMAALPGGGPAEEIVSNANTVTATSDGQTILFRSPAPEQPGLWKLNLARQQRSQLVPGNVQGGRIAVTAGDREVIFLSNRTGVQTPWIVAIDGGPPAQITTTSVSIIGWDLSPDGKSIVFLSASGATICDLPTCTSSRPTPAFRGDRVRWTPDGTGVAYVPEAVRTNVWVQPLDGAAARQLTRFTDGRTIEEFAWSRDGKRLAISRSSVTNDIVLFRGLK